MDARTVGYIFWISSYHVRSPDVRCGCWLLIGLEHLVLLVVKVLAGIRSFVFENLDYSIEDNGQKATQGRPNPIDPMVALKRVVDHVGSKGAGGIERAASEINACTFNELRSLALGAMC